MGPVPLPPPANPHPGPGASERSLNTASADPRVAHRAPHSPCPIGRSTRNQPFKVSAEGMPRPPVPGPGLPTCLCVHSPKAGAPLSEEHTGITHLSQLALAPATWGRPLPCWSPQQACPFCGPKPVPQTHLCPSTRPTTVCFSTLPPLLHIPCMYHTGQADHQGWLCT